MELQHTIVKPAVISGRGLFTGAPAQVVFRPAPANHGIVFVRKDLGDAPIPALIENVMKRPRRTALRHGEATVETCEHCLSAVAACRIDNLVIEIDGPELPGLDGSSKPYVDVLTEAGTQAHDAPRRRLVVTDPVVLRHDSAMVAALPDDKPGMQVLYDLDFEHQAAIGRQFRVFDFENSNYTEQIAPARTFVLEAEARALQAQGIGTHLTEKDVLVIGKYGPLGGNTFRFPDEPVRHKIMDLIGDLYLLGMPIQGKIIAYKSGHALNHALARKLANQQQYLTRAEQALHRSVLDSRRLARILPHRYPMLLVDRVIEIDADRRAVGIKNVTVNEPFFQGHYPGMPIMPGVLVVEAMAQLAGVLVAQKVEHTGKLAILLSLDRVKLRKPVTPGDQLVMEAEMVRMHTRIAHVRCRAYIGEELAAEAEIKFMLVLEDRA